MWKSSFIFVTHPAHIDIFERSFTTQRPKCWKLWWSTCRFQNCLSVPILDFKMPLFVSCFFSAVDNNKTIFSSFLIQPSWNTLQYIMSSEISFDQIVMFLWNVSNFCFSNLMTSILHVSNERIRVQIIKSYEYSAYELRKSVNLYRMYEMTRFQKITIRHRNISFSVCPVESNHLTFD